MSRASGIETLFTAAALAVCAAPLTADAQNPRVPGAFGRAVAIAGDLALVTEPGTGRGNVPGRVHVYQRGATGWRTTTQLPNAASAPGDGFGATVALSGTTALVGQTTGMAVAGGRGGPPPTPKPEMVHAFTRGADGKWKAAGTLASPFAAGTGFGSAIALSGDVALVGAPGEGGRGAVAVYTRSGGAWSQAGTLPAGDVPAGALFGASLAIDGNRAAVGAPAAGGKGTVHVFVRSGTAWTADGPALSGRRAADNGQFGASLVLNGDKLFVGAPGSVFTAFTTAAPAPAAGGRGGQGGRGGFGGMGAVVEFARNAAGAWVEGALLTPYDFPAAARLGASLAVAGDELWAGAPLADNAGRIYTTRQDKSGGFTGMNKLMLDVAPDPSVRPQFGASMAISGNSAVVGMPADAAGLGTVAFLARGATGAWTLRSTDHPPVMDRFDKVTGKEEVCGASGMAKSFQCSNTGLLAFLPVQAIGGGRATTMNDNWGWTDPQTGREYALAGRNDGTAFIDVTDPENPKYLGSLPKTPGVPSGIWRDIKTYKDHAYIVADGSGAHGMQIFDLTRLRNVKTPQMFKPDTTYREIASAHNIVINETSGFAYAVGASAGGTTCGGGLHMIDIRSPKEAKFAGCFQDARTGRGKTGYSHDAQCITYHGPDTRYTGREICIGSNETAISFADVTDKSKTVALSFISYPNVGYAHQGWFSEDHKYFYVDDELDEIAALSDTTGTHHALKGTRTMIFDVTKLDDPVLAKEYIGPVRSADHNLYVKGNKIYMANYGSGLRIVDISDPVNPKEVGFLDTYPDDNNEPAMQGAWSNYPYFKSGTIIVTSMTEGMFLVKDRTTKIVP